MTTTGRIILVHNGREIATKLYHSPAKRAAYIEEWKKLYGPAFAQGEVIDLPDGPGEISAKKLRAKINSFRRSRKVSGK